MDYIVTKLDEVADEVPKDFYTFKVVETVKDITDKDVQVYKTVGSFTKAELEDTIARLTAELSTWQERLDVIKAEEVK
ncbi:hypothetical protein M0R04_12850 [Candidatus Dojkabacteria bacterium]|jgi:hypothetical protein|nr:hypothetical protein [Candidatus Dojkabacteria bacterium]